MARGDAKGLDGCSVVVGGEVAWAVGPWCKTRDFLNFLDPAVVRPHSFG